MGEMTPSEREFQIDNLTARLTVLLENKQQLVGAPVVSLDAYRQLHAELAATREELYRVLGTPPDSLPPSIWS
jgi:hypothetical protein